MANIETWPLDVTLPDSIRQLTLAAAAVALVGCATPRFQTIYHYEPATGMAGRACVNVCERTLAGCRTDCESAWQSCTARVEPQVEARYAQTLTVYAADIDRYRRELERYDWGLRPGWDQGFGGPWYSPWPYHPWYGYGPLPLPPAEQPTRESVRAGLLKEQCHDDCGCAPKYDACYLGCGGRMIPETRCVADCPAEQQP